MKNIIILLMLLCFVPAFAQDTEQPATTSKSGVAILPAAGDIAIGADALPYLNYLGNIFNNTANNTLALGSNNLYFRYHLTDNSAVRAILSVVSTKNITRNYVQDDAAVLADPLTNAVVEDKSTTVVNGYALNVGYMMTRGTGRLQGFYGAQVGYGFNRTTMSYQYGNNITIANTAPTTFQWGRVAERKLEVDNGITQNLGLGIFAGVEYYFLPKICVGGEVALSYGYQWSSQSNSKNEKMIGGKIVEIDKQVSPGNKFFSLTTFRPATYGGLYLMFHF
jgi:hypothetical protein